MCYEGCLILRLLSISLLLLTLITLMIYNGIIMENLRNCQWCHVEFSPSRVRQIYCTRRCKELACQSRDRGGTGEKLWNTRGDQPRKNGWTFNRIKQKTEEQQGKCLICGLVPVSKEFKFGLGGLVPDHKHSNPPVPRGLLCQKCNAGLGLFKDDPDILERAADYLRRYSA